MNQHINKLDPISRLRAELETTERVHRSRVFRMPRQVRVPGKTHGFTLTHRVPAHRREQLILTK